jgi:hypothetical protein
MILWWKNTAPVSVYPSTEWMEFIDVFRTFNMILQVRIRLSSWILFTNLRDKMVFGLTANFSAPQHFVFCFSASTNPILQCLNFGWILPPENENFAPFKVFFRFWIGVVVSAVYSSQLTPSSAKKM